MGNFINHGAAGAEVPRTGMFVLKTAGSRFRENRPPGTSTNSRRCVQTLGLSRKSYLRPLGGRLGLLRRRAAPAALPEGHRRRLGLGVWPSKSATGAIFVEAMRFISVCVSFCVLVLVLLCVYTPCLYLGLGVVRRMSIYYVPKRRWLKRQSGRQEAEEQTYITFGKRRARFSKPRDGQKRQSGKRDAEKSERDAKTAERRDGEAGDGKAAETDGTAIPRSRRCTASARPWPRRWRRN